MNLAARVLCIVLPGVAITSLGACSGRTDIETRLPGCDPTDEVCNGRDDDCDLVVDEGCDCIAGSSRTCGSSLGACQLGTQSCIDGRWGLCEGDQQGSTEVCNGIDDNCDGAVDEACDCLEASSHACSSSVGACEAGTQHCVAGQWSTCEGAVLPTDETCNGEDDDCDGQADEGFGVGVVCDGDDLDHCADDVMTCGGCSSGGDDVELCNDMLDNDCDAVIDEGCQAGPTCVGAGCSCFADVCTCDTGGCIMSCGAGEECQCAGGACYMTCSGGAACECNCSDPMSGCVQTCTSGATCTGWSHCTFDVFSACIPC